MTDIIMASAEQGNVDIHLCDGKYVVKFDPNNINEKTMETFKRAVFNALTPKEIKPRKNIRITDLTPEQLEAKRASRIRWYSTNKEIIKIYRETK
jgi:Tfp pilus assembly pilus retraction ATPase PilT